MCGSSITVARACAQSHPSTAEHSDKCESSPWRGLSPGLSLQATWLGVFTLLLGGVVGGGGGVLRQGFFVLTTLAVLELSL